MKNFIKNNTDWLYAYFEKVKGLFEMLSLFFVFQTFLYTSNFENIKDFGQAEVLALKQIFWGLIFLISFLLFTKTDSEYTNKDDDTSETLFREAVFSKFIMRVIIYSLSYIILIILVKTIKNNSFNFYLLMIYMSFGTVFLIELIRFLSFKFLILKKKIK